MASERHYLPTNCCFVFSIRTGAIILAVLGIFGGGMNIISESYGLAVMAPDIETYIDRYRIEILEQFGTYIKTYKRGFAFSIFLQFCHYTTIYLLNYFA